LAIRPVACSEWCTLYDRREEPPMTNVQTVQEIYAAFGRGDVPSILDRCAENVAWEAWADNTAQQAGVDHLAPRQGRAGVAEFFGIVGSFKVTDFQVLALLDGGDKVGAEVVIDAELPNGNRFRDEELHLWSFDADGKVSRMRHYVDTAKHMAAAGVSTAEGSGRAG
jgi:ketosteroid isomerase-like protein